MKNQSFVSLVLILIFHLSYGQNNRIELKTECSEYFFRNTLNNENYTNDECAKILNKKGNFIIKGGENEYITFSIDDAKKIDKKMFHISNNDTIAYASYIKGKLIERIQYEEKEISVKEYLKNSLYYIEYPNYNEEWFLNNELIFKSKAILLVTNLKKELLKITFIDELGIQHDISLIMYLLLPIIII